MKLFRMFWIVLATILAVYSAFCVYIYMAQDRMFYFPTKDFAVNPDDYDLNFQDVFINVGQDETIHGWYFSQAQNQNAARTVLVCHGNGGNISHRLETVIFLLQRGVNVMMFDYRGYGRSSGRPRETNTYDDVKAAYDWLISEKSAIPDDIIIFGRSLGGAVAVDLASKENCGGLIVESSFDSAREMAKGYFPFFPAGLLIKYSYDSISKISKVNCPKLFTHSPADDLVPFDRGKKLFEAAPEPKSFYEISGGHNERTYLDDPGYIKAIDNLLGSKE
ncbi:MAG: alpha/beta hydrolase [candidate division Zixibacteria bacterium]